MNQLTASVGLIVCLVSAMWQYSQNNIVWGVFIAIAMLFAFELMKTTEEKE